MVPLKVQRTIRASAAVSQRRPVCTQHIRDKYTETGTHTQRSNKYTFDMMRDLFNLRCDIVTFQKEDAEANTPPQLCLCPPGD